MTDATPFPVPDFNDLTVAIGAPASAYLTYEQMGADHYRQHSRHSKVASELFFQGGSLAQHGLRFKPEIDAPKAMRAIRAFLCSFDPKHEIKIGTVGYALAQWCEDHVPAQTPHQAQRKRRRKGKPRVKRASA